jgi:SAM-dependent methyltransferase
VLANEALAEQAPDVAPRLRFVEGTAEAIPVDDSSVDLIWCKEALYYFDLDKAFAECLRVLRPGGRVLIYNMFHGEHIEPREAQRQWTDGVIPANQDYTNVEAAMLRSGLQIEACTVLGSEGGEYSQEQTGEPGRRLLHAARLLRDPERYIARFGQENYDIMLGDCLWHIYRMIGKLSARVYVLRAPSG